MHIYKIKMKHLFIIFGILFSCSSFAQIRIDTTRRDTLGAFRFRHAIFNATCLTGETEATFISPTGGLPLCFNRRMVVKSTVRGSTLYYCMYFNTEKGYVATFKPSYTLPTSICNLDINAEDFYLTVTNLKGNVFHYSNYKKGNSLKHTVVTGHTVRNPYLFFSDSVASPPLFRKNGSQQFINGKIMGVPYKTDGENTPKFYLYGQTMPAKIRYQTTLGIVELDTLKLKKDFSYAYKWKRHLQLLKFYILKTKKCVLKHRHLLGKKLSLLLS